MIKCEVLQSCFMKVTEGTIVEVTEKQFELLRHKLRPLKEKKETAKVEEEPIEKIEVEVPVKETRKKKK